MRPISFVAALLVTALAVYASPALEARDCPQCDLGYHEVSPPAGYCEVTPPPCCDICGKSSLVAPAL